MIMSKQVSLPKNSLILQEVEYHPKKRYTPVLHESFQLLLTLYDFSHCVFLLIFFSRLRHSSSLLYISLAPFFIPCTPSGLEPLTFRIPLAYHSLFYTTTLRGSIENYTLKKSFLFYIAMYSFICLTRVSCCTKICIGFLNQLGPW